MPEKVIDVVDTYYPTDVLVLLCGHTMYAYKDDIWTQYKSKHYISGGIVGGGCIYIYSYDLIRCIDLTTHHFDLIPRDLSHGCLIYVDTILNIGGRGRSWNGHISTTSAILRWTNRWEHVGDLKLTHDSCSCVIYNDEIYIIGGYDSNRWFDKCLDDVEVFNLQTRQSRVVASMKHARTNHTAFVYNNTIYVVGGYTDTIFPNSDGSVNEAEMYDPSTNKWVPSDIPFSVSDCRISVVNDVLYCYCGGLYMYHPVYSWVKVNLPSNRLSNILLACINEQYLQHISII